MYPFFYKEFYKRRKLKITDIRKCWNKYGYKMRETTQATREMVKQMLTINQIFKIAKLLYDSGLTQDKAIRLASTGWDPAQRLN